MLLTDLSQSRARSGKSRLATLAALGRTLEARRQVDSARRVLARWRAGCARPVVSVSGGKDSTLLLQLAREIDPSIPAVQAVGPARAYLRDQSAHRARLRIAAGGVWHEVAYPYDFEAVLEGGAYPHGLKQRTLAAWYAAHPCDGVALGLRASESRGRLWNARRGATYRPQHGLLVAQPLVRFSADLVLGCLLVTNRLPLNPVYEHDHLQPDYERLRDGTWTPHQTADAHGYRAWLAWHYPEHVPDYDRAVIALRGGR